MCSVLTLILHLNYQRDSAARCVESLLLRAAPACLCPQYVLSLSVETA